MIITRSPLRISLGGGGTDLPSYYRKHGGFVLSAAINRYVYITINEAFRPRIILKYSKLEDVERWDDIQHPIIREALQVDRSDGAVPRDRQPLGYSGRYGIGFVRKFYDRSAACLAYDETEFCSSAGIGRTSLSHRNRFTERTGRQAGSVHFGIRRHYLFRVSAG